MPLELQREFERRKRRRVFSSWCAPLEIHKVVGRWRDELAGGNGGGVWSLLTKILTANMDLTAMKSLFQRGPVFYKIPPKMDRDY
jgi:hypothetical protein